GGIASSACDPTGRVSSMLPTTAAPAALRGALLGGRRVRLPLLLNGPDSLLELSEQRPRLRALRRRRDPDGGPTPCRGLVDLDHHGDVAPFGVLVCPLPRPSFGRPARRRRIRRRGTAAAPGRGPAACSGSRSPRTPGPRRRPARRARAAGTPRSCCACR